MQGMTGIATGSYTITTTPTELCFTVSSACDQLKMHNGEPCSRLKQYAGMDYGVDYGVDVGEDCPLFTTPPSLICTINPLPHPVCW